MDCSVTLASLDFHHLFQNFDKKNYSTEHIPNFTNCTVLDITMGSANSIPVKSNDNVLVKNNHYSSLLTNSINLVVELGSSLIGLTITILIVWLCLKCFCPHWIPKSCCPGLRRPTRRRRASEESGGYEEVTRDRDRPSRGVCFSDSVAKFFTLRKKPPSYFDLPYAQPLTQTPFVTSIPQVVTHQPFAPMHTPIVHAVQATPVASSSAPEPQVTLSQLNHALQQARA